MKVSFLKTGLALVLEDTATAGLTVRSADEMFFFVFWGRVNVVLMGEVGLGVAAVCALILTGLLVLEVSATVAVPGCPNLAK